MNYNLVVPMSLMVIACVALPLGLIGPRWWYVRNLPPPAVGQVWRSQHSGRRIRICDVRTTDQGTLDWTFQIESTGSWAIDGFNPIPMSGYGLRNWWFMLYEERRVLEATP